MKHLSLRVALSCAVVTVVGALALGSLVACGGSGPAVAANGGASTDPRKWPADDRSMCDWKNKPELEVSETAGPGAYRPNVRRVYKTFGDAETRHKTLVCREIDTNLDGIKDVVRTFNAKGEALHEEADTDYDGRIDVWSDFVDGRISEERIDTNHDGKPDVWKFYVGGQLSRMQRDTNFDGKPDIWEIYTKGHLERMGIDLGFDGHVDRWDRDAELQRAAEMEEVKAREQLQNAQGDGGTPAFAAGAFTPASTGDAGAPKKPAKK